MKKFNFWKAEKAVVKDPTLNAKSVGLWLVTVVTTMVVTWLLAPVKKQECCKEAEAEPKEKFKDEPVEEAKVDSVDVSEDESESEEAPEEASEGDSVEEPKDESTDESEEETSRIKKREEFIKGFKNPWKNKKAKRGNRGKSNPLPTD